MPPLLVTDAIPPLLTALGKNAREVASALRAEIIVGRRGATTFRNPIVRYINRHLDIGGRIIIPIDGGVLTVVRDGTRHTIRVPDAVNTFLNRFTAASFRCSNCVSTAGVVTVLVAAVGGGDEIGRASCRE